MDLKYLWFWVIAFLLLTASKVQAQNGNNQSPVVKLIKPKAGEPLKWNSPIPYAIHVADAEDGNSAYEEIAGREVILLVKYLKDPSLEQAYVSKIDQDLAPLLSMVRSNCLNCHAANTKLIGPSFDLIAKRYSAADNAKAYLAEKIIKGSTGGVWGEEKMPPNPDLARDEVALIVDWILKQKDDPVLFQLGLEGAVRISEAPAGPHRGVFVLTAAYEDRGSDGAPKERRLGRQTMVVGIK